MPFLTLNIPTEQPGFGVPTDVQGLVGRKTVVMAGPFRGNYILQGSEDGIVYSPMLQFQANPTGDIFPILFFDHNVKSVRVERRSPDVVSMYVGGVTRFALGDF